MPDLNFELAGSEVLTFAAVPTLIFKLHMSNTPTQEKIHNILLHCQIQLDVARRRYSPAAQGKLLELFGEPERWSNTLRPLLWTSVNMSVPAFTASTLVDMPVPCSYDFEVTSTKYFAALNDGEIPLTFLFSGTIFYEHESIPLQVAQIPWSKEATYRMPVTHWQEMIAHYYPNSNWIRMHNDIFDQLYQYKASHALPTWDEVFTQLLLHSQEVIKP